MNDDQTFEVYSELHVGLSVLEDRLLSLPYYWLTLLADIKPALQLLFHPKNILYFTQDT